MTPDGDGPVGPTRMLARQAGHRRGRGTCGGRRARARRLVRLTRRGGGRGLRRLLPALGNSADGRRNGASRASDRTQPCARHDSHRARRVGRGSAADGSRQSPGATRPRTARGNRARARDRQLAAGRCPQRSPRRLRAMVAEHRRGAAGEYRHGVATVETGEMFGGLDRYASGGWRRGEFT